MIDAFLSIFIYLIKSTSINFVTCTKKSNFVQISMRHIIQKPINNLIHGYIKNKKSLRHSVFPTGHPCKY